MTNLSKITELGKPTSYSNSYDPGLLVSVPRVKTIINQYGYDIWRCWEMSWLNIDNKPEVATLVISYNANSPAIVESKSLKLYLGSFNFNRFSSAAKMLKTIQCDISYTVGANVKATITEHTYRTPTPGICIDSQIQNEIDDEPNPKKLSTSNNNITETIHSNLFRSCCPVTAQPDWASILISYTGNQINHAKLLSYLLSYRNHAAFHESCISNIHADIYQYCQPLTLTVTGLFTRRGGLDINPCRSTDPNEDWQNIYLNRQ
ncbi:MAG: NADPH-dependent 7-cyano-7-deazaguanine reductase QueF [Legionellales bacterium]|jgi:7-cyano-7-deazaguanine reductase|nr:NADPH-dependent 7-cyano-7-deazaguanine reductase QueF [Legionellales bacterium]